MPPVLIRIGVNAPAAETVKEVLAVWVRPDVDPVTVNGYVPTGVFADVVTVKVEDPAPATDVGLKPGVTPEGSPLTVKLTLEVKPPRAVSVTV